MKKIFLLIAITGICLNSYCQSDNLLTTERKERNKEIARDFYQDLWFTNNTDKYADYVADEYVVHDIGDRKGVTEPAIEQKEIADFFWENGSWDSKINYQIAEGDLVATRWEATFSPSSLLGSAMMGSDKIAIINVFRFNDEGKIVEIWNHRHDIDTPQTMRFTLQGLLIGLGIALIPTIIAVRLRRKIKAIKTTRSIE
ncbi:MAG: ester cyclase [Flavobacteriales bacterium]|nr:ester cyclase [Flavobacteriales bacterium]